MNVRAANGPLNYAVSIVVFRSLKRAQQRLPYVLRSRARVLTPCVLHVVCREMNPFQSLVSDRKQQELGGAPAPGPLRPPRAVPLGRVRGFSWQLPW